ncbi:MAG: TonB-dependent receptor, partial [Acidobacteriota bacterium]|nr:TonB-dependent receptor [Acidobacteriota bacterium]
VLPGATVTLTSIGTGQVLTDVSGGTGAFLFPQVPVGKYKVSVNLEGFKAAEFTDVEVAVGQEYSLTAKLAVGAMTELVTVTAGSSLVSTTTPEVTSTVMQRQVLDIPLANRDITNLIKLQAGVVGIPNRANTTINGGRPTWTQVTLDGINIQDNFIRTNSLDFLPNRPTSDNVAEFSITTSVSGADSAGGATSVRMVTPSGTNRFTGSVFEFNRDSKFAANSFFNNAAKPSVPKPELSRHQFGGRVGGPVMRDKLFFFFNYEGFRQTTQLAQNLTIPANADFYNGVFRYVDLGGNVQSVNVLQLSGLPVDPSLRTDVLSRIPAPSNVNNFDAGNSTAARNLNTAGYRFNQNDLNNRDSYTGRLDYSATSSHNFDGVFSYFKETDDRTDLDRVTTDRPKVFTSSDPKRFALAWRWAASSNFNNELRGGANLSPVAFVSEVDFGRGIIFNPNLGITNPVPTFQSQGRFTDTYQLNDNASYVRGNHQMQIGGSWQRNRVNPYNFAGQFPAVSFGFSSAAPVSVQLTSGQFPGGISAADLAGANAAASFLGGIVSSVGQTFQVRDRTSGFVAGIPSNENYTLDNIATYVQDNWRWKPNFTIRAGLKWEYYSPLREDNNVGLLPILNGRSLEEALLDPTTKVGFPDGDYYKKDLNNFGPTIGFAWDVTKDGRTAVRGGYSLSFVNEETVTVGRGVSRGNAGLTTGVTLTNQFATVSSGVPLPTTPAFLTERTQADQLGLDNSAVLWGIDPNIKAPHVHQVSVGIQRELPWSTAAEVRYVGTFGREIWRGTDFNQIQLSQAFRDDFNRARSNGFLAQQAGKSFSPVFDSTVPGSQQLTVLPTFGLLTNATAVNNIQQNQVAGLADFYITSLGTAALRASARQTFFQNPGIYAANGISNGGFSDYNSLQIELRRQFRNGFFAQANYTLADTNTNSSGQGQNRFEAFMDNNRQGLNTGRSIFQVTHVMNANAIYELPFGRDRKWLNGGGLTDVLVGGWQLGTIVAWQSGSPFTIFSGRGTFNRVGRSNCGTPIGCNTASTNLTVSQIQGLLGVFKQPDGRIYFIDPKVIDPATGRAVGPDNLGNTAGFPGQVFFNPGAGEVGTLPILAFDGPPVFRIDLALSKKTRITDRFNLELKGEAFNLTNTTNFFTGDLNINSPTFGRLTDVTIGSRVIQLSARLNF